MISTIIFGIERLNGGRFGGKGWKGKSMGGCAHVEKLTMMMTMDVAAFDCNCVPAHSDVVV